MVVCDTSPLIALALIDKIDLLDKLYSDWFVPERVAAEATRDQKPFSNLLSESLRSHVVEIKNKTLVRELNQHIDQGEAEVIALAEKVVVLLGRENDREK